MYVVALSLLCSCIYCVYVYPFISMYILLLLIIIVLVILDGYWTISQAMNRKYPQGEEISSHLGIQGFTYCFLISCHPIYFLAHPLSPFNLLHLYIYIYMCVCVCVCVYVCMYVYMHVHFGVTNILFFKKDNLYLILLFWVSLGCSQGFFFKRDEEGQILKDLLLQSFYLFQVFGFFQKTLFKFE